MIDVAISAVGLKNTIKNLGIKKGVIPKTITRIFKESGRSVQNRAKRIVRVDTGRLQRSIKYRVLDKRKRSISLWIYTDVYYSVYVERRYPYLFPAMEMEKPIITKKLNSFRI